MEYEHWLLLAQDIILVFLVIGFFYARYMTFQFGETLDEHGCHVVCDPETLHCDIRPVNETTTEFGKTENPVAKEEEKNDRLMV